MKDSLDKVPLTPQPNARSLFSRIGRVDSVRRDINVRSGYFRSQCITRRELKPDTRLYNIMTDNGLSPSCSVLYTILDQV